MGGVSPGRRVLGFASVGKVLPVLVSEGHKSGRGFVRARFRNLVYKISFMRQVSPD